MQELSDSLSVPQGGVRVSSVSPSFVLLILQSSAREGVPAGACIPGSQ